MSIINAYQQRNERAKRNRQKKKIEEKEKKAYTKQHSEYFIKWHDIVRE